MTTQAKHESSEPPFTAAETAMEGRVYLHETCGQLTRISGKELVRLCNPFRFVSRTICSGCEARDDIEHFHWRDTGESIGSFRRRMRDESPTFCKVWFYILAPAMAALIGIDLVAQIRSFLQLDAQQWIEIPLGILLVVPLFSRFVSPWLMQALLDPTFHQQR